MIIDLLASEYGWQSVEKAGFYDAVVLLDLVAERKKENIMIMSVATQSDPKELRKRLFVDSNVSVKLDESGLERFKQTLNRRSNFTVK